MGAQNLDGFHRLRLDALHDVDDEDGNVGNGAAPLAKVRERLMAWRVYEKKAGYGEFDFAP